MIEIKVPNWGALIKLSTTIQLIPEHVTLLKEAVVKEGLVDRVIWYP